MALGRIAVDSVPNGYPNEERLEQVVRMVLIRVAGKLPLNSQDAGATA